MKQKYDNEKLSKPVNGLHVSKYIMSFCKELLSNILPHIRVKGERINMNDCSIIDILNFKGSYFPKIHNDLEWTYFSSNTLGFQVWYLVKNDSDYKGNMFLSNMVPICGTQQTKSTGNKVFFKFNGGHWKHDNQPTNDFKPFASNLSDLNLKYVNIDAGECLVFHKNLLHMSDPRNTERVAINFRVAIHDKFGKLTINNTKLDSYLRYKNPKLKKYINSITPDKREESFHIGLFDLV